VRDGKVWVEDLGSRNGTRLNGQLITEPTLLDNEDALELGTMLFRIQVVTSSEAVDQHTAPAATTANGTGPVLVVDDDETTARTLAMLLESWGHRVRVAHDGPEAIEEAKQNPPEVVFLDIGLPSMSGVEVARRLRDDAGLKCTRLVAVTGDEGAMEVLQSRAHFEKLLIKPVSAHVLREAMANAC
jgi:CheY-like chemotaxis protein